MRKIRLSFAGLLLVSGPLTVWGQATAPAPRSQAPLPSSPPADNALPSDPVFLYMWGASRTTFQVYHNTLNVEDAWAQEDGPFRFEKQIQQTSLTYQQFIGDSWVTRLDLGYEETSLAKGLRASGLRDLATSVARTVRFGGGRLIYLGSHFSYSLGEARPAVLVGERKINGNSYSGRATLTPFIGARYHRGAYFAGLEARSEMPFSREFAAIEGLSPSIFVEAIAEMPLDRRSFLGALITRGFRDFGSGGSFTIHQGRIYAAYSVTRDINVAIDASLATHERVLSTARGFRTETTSESSLGIGLRKSI